MKYEFEDSDGKRWFFNDVETLYKLMENGLINEKSIVHNLGNNKWIYVANIPELEKFQEVNNTIIGTKHFKGLLLIFLFIIISFNSTIILTFSFNTDEEKYIASTFISLLLLILVYLISPKLKILLSKHKIFFWLTLISVTIANIFISLDTRNKKTEYSVRDMLTHIENDEMLDEVDYDKYEKQIMELSYNDIINSLSVGKNYLSKYSKLITGIDETVIITKAKYNNDSLYLKRLIKRIPKDYQDEKLLFFSREVIFGIVDILESEEPETYDEIEFIDNMKTGILENRDSAIEFYSELQKSLVSYYTLKHSIFKFIQKNLEYYYIDKGEIKFKQNRAMKKFLVLKDDFEFSRIAVLRNFDIVSKILEKMINGYKLLKNNIKSEDS